MKMSIMVYNKAGEVLGFDRIRFSTKDPRIVIVSKTGWIRMFGGGETIVTARHQTLEASVFVHTEKIAGVFIEPKTFNLYLNGQSEIFKVNVFNTLGHMIKKPRKIISLKDESIAKLDGDTLTGLQIGETTLRVKVAAKIAEAKVKVKEGLPPFAKEDREKNKK